MWKRIKFDFFFVLGLLTTLLLLIKFFNIGYFDTWLVISVFSSFRLLLFKEYKIIKHVKTWLVSAAFIASIWFLTSFLGILGVWLALLGFLVYRLWKGKQLLMNSMRAVEKIIFGKPLDKSEFKKGEKPSIYKQNGEKYDKS